MAYLAAWAFVLMVTFMSYGRILFFKYQTIRVIHKSSIWILAIRATSSEFEECARTLNSKWQGYGALEAKFTKASNIMSSDLRT